MIRVFRSIRQKLLDGARISKYLPYALGEIILVVIGILIALQVNNANEVRKSNIEVRNILQNLHQEFESNQQDLNKAIKNVEWTKEGGLKLLSIMGRANEYKNKVDLDSLMEVSLFWPTWEPSNFVMKELKNSGKLTLLQNSEIVKLLFEWERHSEYVNDWNRRMERSSQNIVDFIKEHGSLRDVNHRRISISASSLSTNNISLFDDVRFENQIDEKVVYTQFLEGVYHNASELIQEILNESKQFDN
jgi:hypothetical protein